MFNHVMRRFVIDQVRVRGRVVLRPQVGVVGRAGRSRPGPARNQPRYLVVIQTPTKAIRRQNTSDRARHNGRTRRHGRERGRTSRFASLQARSIAVRSSVPESGRRATSPRVYSRHQTRTRSLPTRRPRRSNSGVASSRSHHVRGTTLRRGLPGDSPRHPRRPDSVVIRCVRDPRVVGVAGPAGQ